MILGTWEGLGFGIWGLGYSHAGLRVWAQGSGFAPHLTLSMLIPKTAGVRNSLNVKTFTEKYAGMRLCVYVRSSSRPAPCWATIMTLTLFYLQFVLLSIRNRKYLQK